MCSFVSLFSILIKVMVCEIVNCFFFVPSKVLRACVCEKKAY